MGQKKLGETCRRFTSAVIKGIISTIILRVSVQSGISLLYIMLEIHHSGRELSICYCLSFHVVTLILQQIWWRGGRGRGNCREFIFYCYAS